MKNIQAPGRNAEDINNGSSKDILHRHLSFFQENNLDAMLDDYSDESVLITQETSYSGLEEIKGFLAGLISQFPKQKSTIELDRSVINDDMVYIVWHGTSPAVDVSFATDTFIIKNGKIQYQTFAGQLEFKG